MEKRIDRLNRELKKVDESNLNEKQKAFRKQILEKLIKKISKN